MSVVPFRRPDPDETVLDRYTEYLWGQGLAPRTIRIYAAMIQRAVAWLAENRNTNLDDARAYDVVELARMVPQNRSSLAQLRSSLGHYWTMTGRHQPPVKAIRIPRQGEAGSKALTEEETTKLMAAAKDRHPEGTAVYVGLYLALRVGEICQTRWDRFNDDMTWYSVTNVKGGAVDRLPVHPALREHLRLVKSAQKVLGQDTGSPYVFPGRAGRDYATEATVWKWVRQLSQDAGLGKIHTHRLRHTALTTANDATGDLRAVSKFARHSRIETTMRYTRTSSQALERVMESLDYTNMPDPVEDEKQSGPRWGPARSG